MEHNSWCLHLNITLELFHLYFSIKFLNEDEWMIDPVMIADTYGPEVSPFLLYHYFSSINKYGIMILAPSQTKRENMNCIFYAC